MSDAVMLAGTFATFVVGTACLGATLSLARSRRDEMARAFLVFYVPLTVLVLGALLLAFMQVVATPSARTVVTVEYVEAFIGRYGVMVGLVLFAHTLFARRGAGTRLLVGIVLAAFGAQHITEFVLGGRWDTFGDVAEDVLFATVVAYAVWLGLTSYKQPADRHVLARRFVALLVIGVPVAVHDLFIVDGPGFRIYPFWYCATGLAMVLALAARQSTEAAVIPSAWDLSPREKDVVRLVRQGLSNRDIARQLAISPNTVKTHVRAIFDKSGFRSRAALIATLTVPGVAGNSPPHVTGLLES